MSRSRRLCTIFSFWILRNLGGGGKRLILPALVGLLCHGPAFGGDVLTVEYATQAGPVMSVLTHSGATVAAVVAEMRGNRDDTGRRALVQPFLAPMSHLLAGAPIGDDAGRPWRDLQSELAAVGDAAGSARPAWRDLLEEGRYRVCYDGDAVRLFAPGWDALAAWRASWPLLRFPVRFLRDSGRSRCARIELFAYENDYSSLSLRVARQPYTMDPVAVDAALEGLATLNLSALDDFMRTGTTPLAVEVDDLSRLYLYGREGQTGTLAGSGMTLADLAVAYRAVFWCGDSEPYVSLDEHADNRLVAVNFGGLLADTRIGRVTLDADRYFKMVTTGLDPVEKRDISDRVRAHVADFIPGAVRDLPSEPRGTAAYRFWFYPDSLQVATNGNIGAVTSPRFLADIERRDGAARVSLGHRRSIDDLNERYESYSRAVPTYAELDNVGYLLALMSWLRETQVGKRLDLAALLSVELPPCRTERAIRKSMVVNCYTGPIGMLDEKSPGFLPRTRIFDFSDSLGQCDPGDTDAELLTFGARCFDGLSNTTYEDAAERAAGQDLEALATQLRLKETELDELSRAIERTVVDPRSVKSVDAYNAQVRRFEAARVAFNEQVAVYNGLVGRQNEASIGTRMFVSVGGGIDLSLKRAPIVQRRVIDPVLREVTSMRPVFVDAGKVQAAGGWIRSRP